MEIQLAEIQDTDKFAHSLELANDIITKDYLYHLNDYEVAPIPGEMKEIDIAEYTRIYKFTKMVSDKKENFIDRFVTVLNAAYSSNASIVTFIFGQKDSVEYYLGVVSKDIDQQRESIKTQGETLKGVLLGNFPGLEIQAISGEAKKRTLKNAFVHDYITCVSGIASVRNEKENSYGRFVQGIEHLVDSLQGREYGIVVIADPVSAEEITDVKIGYESLYTQLSPFLKTAVSINESESITLTQSHTEGITNSIGESTSLTQNYSRTSGWSESSSHGKSRNNERGRLAGTSIGVGIGVAASMLTGGAATPLAVAAAYAGGKVGSEVGAGTIGSNGENWSETFSENGSVTESSGNTTSTNISKASQKSDTSTETEGETHGKTLQFSNENRTVKDLLEMIDKQMERLRKCEAYGAFNCAAYVISSDPETNAIVSSGYNALMRGEHSSLQSSHINNWNIREENGRNVKEYLTKLSHPLFINPIKKDILLSSATISNSYELAVSLGLPRKSISGLPVFEMAAFGRNVYETNPTNNVMKRIRLGKIYHMGVEQPTTVDINLKSLAMHTFITGSTGSGKSSTVYQLLSEFRKQGVHYLVVEPAKGEYKFIFGDSAAVYGTNPYVSPLLKLNPFKFPNGIHVLEHIDRLIEIFNVCWSMYAAMPAVLKDSIENAYIDAGWDLTLSRNKYSDKIFPTFGDVLRELNDVIGKSSFSQEVKDNYIGSLATRIKSLTNGIFGEIFDANELGDSQLFDQDVIVDLSRVGSIETKAMIMGILVMRLQEYRMTGGIMNVELKHVTVLEEAHNLLKKTSTEQSSESSNLLGKSVEMLSNAIAEMRTYGEGFIIADQAPGLLDMSVIRNTNTKIIMRLPDINDRELVGKSANLSDEQIKELSKLPTGVAAVYQNDWLEPVLCKIEKFKGEECPYKKAPTVTFSSSGEQKKTLIQSLLKKNAGEKLDMTIGELTDMIVGMGIPTNIKIKALKALRINGTCSLSDISPIIYDLVCDSLTEKEAENADSIEEWKNVFVYAQDSLLAEFDSSNQNKAIECILREQIERYNKPTEYLDTWNEFIRKEVM